MRVNRRQFKCAVCGKPFSWDFDTHTAIETVLLAWGTEVLAHVEEVSIDLCGNYCGLVRRLVPQAAILADRFHVMKLVTHELNQARNAFRLTLSD